MITGVFGGTGGKPKGVELYVIDDIADLSLYGMGSSKNGNNSDTGVDWIFPGGAATANSFIYVTPGTTAEFNEWFGNVNGTIISEVVETWSSLQWLDINGDDALQLLITVGDVEPNSVIDTFGAVGTDGTNEDWEYLDGWAYRNGTTISSGPGDFDVGQWTFSGKNAWDGATANTNSGSSMPIGTFDYV